MKRIKKTLLFSSCSPSSYFPSDSEVLKENANDTFVGFDGPKHPEGFEKHPKNLEEINQTITDEELQYLMSKGFFEGRDPKSWRNWHLLNKGQWKDYGLKNITKVKSLRKFHERDAQKMPIEFWNENRAVDMDYRNIPQLDYFFNHTVKDKIVYPKKKYKIPPVSYIPSFIDSRDRMGMGYGAVNIFEDFPSWVENTPILVDEVTDILINPKNGEFYQKFYIGPLENTMGFTIGNLIKKFGEVRCPGHACVALKVHNMNNDTTIDFVEEDLLSIALNINDIAFKSVIPEYEGRVRTRVRGPLVLTAGMIEWPSFVELSNKEQYIATLENEKSFLDLDIKIEWGRGTWLSDLEGLYRKDEGSNHFGFRRREIKEVKEEDFYPTRCYFGGCRSIRITVHKVAGSRFCLERMECPNPKEQLVVEIYTSPSTTPKEILNFSICETILFLQNFYKQLACDNSEFYPVSNRSLSENNSLNSTDTSVKNNITECSDKNSTNTLEISPHESLQNREKLHYFRSVEEQIKEDILQEEEIQLQKYWGMIQGWESLKRQQDLAGGPPIHEQSLLDNFKYVSENKNLSNETEKANAKSKGDYSNVEVGGNPLEFYKEFNKNKFSLPISAPPRPTLNKLDWLYKELKKEKYAEKNENYDIKKLGDELKKKEQNYANNTLKDENQNIDKTTKIRIENIADISDETIQALKERGYHTVEDIANVETKKLLKIPNIKKKDVYFMKSFFKKK